MKKQLSKKMPIMIVLLLILTIGFQMMIVYGETDSEFSRRGINLLDDTDKINVDSKIDMLVDENNEYVIDNIVMGNLFHRFKPYTQIGRPNFGYTDATYWVRVELHNKSELTEWLLEVDTPKINEITLYRRDAYGDVHEKTTGNHYPFLERDVNHRNFVYKLDIDKGKTKTYYLSLRTGGSMQVPLTIWNPDEFNQTNQIVYLLFGILIGVSVIMTLYNLFLYFSVGDRSYLYYVLFVIMNALLFMTESGLSYQFLWPEQVDWNLRAIVVILAFTNTSALLFSRSFLHTAELIPKVDRIFLLLIVISSLLGIWGLFSLKYAMYATLFATLITVSLVIPTSFISLSKGYRPALIFALGWTIFLFGVFMSILVEIGTLPLITWTKYAWQLTTVIEIVILSLALGDRYRVINEEKNKIEQEVIESREQALENMKKVDKLKDEFLAVTSHELRTPLNGIIGIAETLRDGIAGDVPEEIRSHLWMIIISGRRLSNLVNDILDFSMLQNDELVIEPKPINFYEVTNVVIIVCQPLVKEKPIELINDVEVDIPTVYADENRVQQILYNLIGNAIKFTDSGNVAVSATVEGEHLLIFVTDTGAGIPEDQLDNIFLPFHHGEHQINSHKSNTGIGLNITKNLVELQGGEISVQSIEGEGTEFCFTLPLTEEKASFSEDISSSIATKDLSIDEAYMNDIKQLSLTENEQSAKILIADDEQVNLQVLRNQLILGGYDVIAVSNGADAIKEVKEQTFDLLILDIMMPEMSGYEVCEWIRQYYSLVELPIIMLTAKNQLNDKMTAFELGANDYLAKPSEKEELLSRVKNLIQLRRLNAQLQELNRNLEKKVENRTIELQEANKDLQEMSESRQQMLADIAHEIGTPVTIIHGFIQGVQEGMIQIDHPRYLEMVHHKIKILNRLINDLSDLSKLEAKKINLIQDEVKMSDCLLNIFHQLELDVSETGRSMSLLTPVDEIKAMDLICYIDVGRMEQVFTNLVWNAIKHTPSENGHINISVIINQRKNELTVGVHDNGIGIKEEYLPFIFNRFYKVTPSSADNDQSTGLGLAIAKEIVDAHEGRLIVESKENKGTSFYVTLPIHELKKVG